MRDSARSERSEAGGLGTGQVPGSRLHWVRRHEAAVALALSAALVWIAQFHHFRELGLYEDDYFFISEAMGKPPAYLMTRLQTAFTVLPQGRPLGFFLPDLLSFIGDKLGGLADIYLLGFVLVTLNTFLSYRLLRTRVPVAPAIVGAAVFCLFPADTTKILLTHDFQLQPSLTFALLAALAYAAGRLPLAYLLSAGALLSYENGYLALFALPLFARRWDRALPRALVVNAVSLLGVLGVIVLARIARGEGRATESVGGIGQIVPLFLGSLVLGPARSLAAMFYGPLKAVAGWDFETAALALVALIGFGVLLWTAHRTPRPLAEVVHLGAAGLAMLVLGYALAFTHFPPNAVVGRGTSVHLGATLGMSVLAASVAWLLLTLRPRVATALLAAYLALAVGYYVTIERDFMRSWQLQRGFWQQVVDCCSDVQDGTVLLYELNAADEPTTFIFTNSWADPLVLGETFAFPQAWTNPPRLFSLTEWLNRVEPEGDHLRWWVPAASWDEHWEVLPQGNVILLRRAPDGALTRITGSVDVAGQVLALKAPAAPVAWPPAQLYVPLLK
ncbi:MAG TPA: hypothetical protein VKV73_18550 [Chloroflexota bacterium]|nr:hypothetical protein [Chloroflexota bacterium]